MSHRILGLTLMTLFAGAACGGDDGGDPIDPDAPAAPDAPPPPIDAPPIPPDAPLPSVLGTWSLRLSGGFFSHDFHYVLTGGATGGAITVEHLRRDTNGIFANCTQTERSTGTWSLEAGALNVILADGLTERVTSFLAQLDCNEIYPERAMTADELRQIDLADGPLTFDGPDMITSVGAQLFQWQRD